MKERGWERERERVDIDRERERGWVPTRSSIYLSM